MLYSYNLLKSSYDKNNKILDKLATHYTPLKPYKIKLIKENYKFDGTITIYGINEHCTSDMYVELKQRQDNFIKSIYDGKPLYKDFQLIQTAFQRDKPDALIMYFIYDITNNYILILTSKNIDFNTEITSHNRSRGFEVKKYCCKGYGKVIRLDDGTSKIINLENLQER